MTEPKMEMPEGEENRPLDKLSEGESGSTADYDEGD